MVRGREEDFTAFKPLTAAYPYCKKANDLATKKLATDDLIRGYAQAGYGCYLYFFQTPQLALSPLQQSLPGLAQLDPKNSYPYRNVVKNTLKVAIDLGQLEDAAHLHTADVDLMKAQGDTIWQARKINTYGFYLQVDLHGRVVGAPPITDDLRETTIDVSNQRAGVYLLIYQNRTGQRWTQRVVID